jgi:hypothetical protein
MAYCIFALLSCLLAGITAGSVCTPRSAVSSRGTSGRACASGTTVTRTGRGSWYTCRILPSCLACSRASSLAASVAWPSTPLGSADTLDLDFDRLDDAKYYASGGGSGVGLQGYQCVELPSTGCDAHQVPPLACSTPTCYGTRCSTSRAIGAARGDDRLFRQWGTELLVMRLRHDGQ